MVQHDSTAEYLNELGITGNLSWEIEFRASIDPDQTIEFSPKGDAISPLSYRAVPRIAVDLNDPVSAVNRITAPTKCIILLRLLQCLGDHRTFLSSCFNKLQIGGYMLVIVPHQFLFERKMRLPSRRNSAHRKMYTPNILLADIEEALDPCCFRLRHVGDNDSGYTYDLPLDKEPAGAQDIILCLQKITRPVWADDLERDETPVQPAFAPTRIPIVHNMQASDHIIRPDFLPIERILVVKLDHRGDFVMAEEAFVVLRTYFPKSSITLVCGSWNVESAAKLSIFDEILVFDFFPEDASAEPTGIVATELANKFAMLVGELKFDVAIDYRLYDDTRLLLREIDARQKVGFDRGDTFPWLSLRFNLPSPTSDARAESGLFLTDSFLTCGRHSGYQISFDTTAAFSRGQDLIWGPYRQLGPGRYEFEYLLEPISFDCEVAYDVVTDNSTRTICGGVLPVRTTTHPRITIVSGEPLQRLEFRIKAKPMGENSLEGRIAPFRFFGIRYYRQGAFSGVHQREAMVLLSHLVPLRLRDAYLASST